MARQRGRAKTISEISIDAQPTGLIAVYLIETASDKETRELEHLFGELEIRMQVRLLSKGKLVTYAVQADASDVPLLDDVEEMLKANYGFVVMHRSFDELIYRIVTQLCEDTDSKLLPLPKCNICGKREPFPNTVVNLCGENGEVSLARSYCASCSTEAAATSNKEFVRSLLAADVRDFRLLEEAELVRHPSRKRPIRFVVKAEEAVRAGYPV
jgi:hypothetical protein